jgi:transposase
MKKQHSNEFKAKVALEAIGGHYTIQELSKKYEVHPNMIGLWKKQLIESAHELFDKKGNNKELEEQQKREDIYLREIGHLQIEKEFLKKKYRQLYGREPDL